jgi:hypothetical protein
MVRSSPSYGSLFLGQLAGSDHKRIFGSLYPSGMGNTGHVVKHFIIL